MRKNRGGRQRKRRETGWRDRNMVNRHSREREKKEERGGGDKTFSKE